MGRVGGYGILTGSSAEIEELDTFTCCHCNGVQFIRPGSGTQRGYCFNCNQPTCGKERCLNCIPFERKMEEMENRHRLRKAMDRA